jgi:hypothetical protein
MGAVSLHVLRASGQLSGKVANYCGKTMAGETLHHMRAALASRPHRARIAPVSHPYRTRIAPQQPYSG